MFCTGTSEFRIGLAGTGGGVQDDRASTDG